jgi:hypothetical protein
MTAGQQLYLEYAERQLLHFARQKLTSSTRVLGLLRSLPPNMLQTFGEETNCYEEPTECRKRATLVI